jgi:3',5'-nucleoside bisphosphate phosphatase
MAQLSRVDLHMHSTASDGVYTPEEVVYMAHEKGLAAIALTDHDTVDGLAAAQHAAAILGFTVLSGVELSVEDATGDRHLLGYGINTTHPSLNGLLTTLKNDRVNRIHGMVEKLHRLGVKVSVERVFQIAAGGSLGRPHLARALLEMGAVSGLQAAFDKYIGEGRPAYVPHYQLHSALAIQTIHQAGGVAVLAHPGRYADYRPYVDEMLPLGLDGIEVYYPDHTPSLVEELRAVALKHNLLMTAGSDFHRREGDGSTRIGTVRYPETLDILADLNQRAARYRT